MPISKNSVRLNGDQILRSETVADFCGAVARHGPVVSQGVAAFLCGVNRMRVHRMIQAKRVHVLRCPVGDWVFLAEVKADIEAHRR